MIFVTSRPPPRGPLLRACPVAARKAVSNVRQQAFNTSCHRCSSVGSIGDEHATLLARFKSPTTPDVSSGIRNALHGLLAAHPDLDLATIRYAMLGTTHCTNAIVERRNLNRVGLVRVGAPASLAIKPFVEWPKDLLAAIGGRSMVVEGGYEYDGRETRPLDVAAVRAAAESFAGHVDSVAVSGVFSPADPSQERQAGAILRDVLGDEVPIAQ